MPLYFRTLHAASLPCSRTRLLEPSVFTFPFVMPLRPLSRVASDYSSGSVVCNGILRPLRPLREIKNNSGLFFHAKSAKFLFPFLFNAGAEGVANFVTARGAQRGEGGEFCFCLLFPANLTNLLNPWMRICCRLLCCLANLCYLCINSMPQRWCRKDFIVKVLLKLSSILKLRNFDDDTKMMAVAPHHLIYTYPNRSGYCHIGVGYCFIRVKGSAKA